ncbi:pyridoxal phosphate-dependent aminotransferase [Halorarum salinum]|uniref:Aminotransferase n=1 Tax=Halorarum salinum TaxID=2743089 RepID=A0A7D5L8X6_9EURY|nr:pyridoxal phosphate-dependent aminotransferase [Halobaculum salinum]QLG60455.1 pyridoxal phosphate-dependent aminotransferase [Halobaculum salinum]
MPSPTARVRACDRSRIRVMFDLADEAERAGRDPVRLEVGEPDLDTPEHVIEAAVAALRGGETHYTSNAGLPELRAAIADALDAEYGVRQEPDEVVVTTGGMEALHLAVLATVGQGEELLIPTPAWPNYWTQARLADATPVEVPMPAPEYDLDAERVVDRMGPDTAAVVLCSPSNPTGRVADPDEVRAVVDAAAEHDAYVLADEVYGALTYDSDPEGIASMAGNPEHVLTVGSCSKAFAMTGWRVGWLAGAADVVDEATKVRESTTCCAPTMAQHAALAALTGPRDPVDRMYEAFRERRDYVADRLADMDGVTAPRPEGAFYAFLDPETDEASLPLAKRLLEEGDVVLAPGDGFGEAGRGQLRLSFANSLERLELGLDRIEATI